MVPQASHGSLKLEYYRYHKGKDKVLKCTDRNDVEIKNSDLVYNGVFKVKSLELRFKRYSGEWSPWIHREQVMRYDAVAVFCMTPRR